MQISQFIYYWARLLITGVRLSSHDTVLHGPDVKVTFCSHIVLRYSYGSEF